MSRVLRAYLKELATDLWALTDRVRRGTDIGQAIPAAAIEQDLIDLCRRVELLCDVVGEAAAEDKPFDHYVVGTPVRQPPKLMAAPIGIAAAVTPIAANDEDSRDGPPAA